MATYLNDLMPHKDISYDDFMRRHYEIERLLELLIMTASDIVLHMISARGERSLRLTEPLFYEPVNWG